MRPAAQPIAEHVNALELVDLQNPPGRALNLVAEDPIARLPLRVIFQVGFPVFLPPPLELVAQCPPAVRTFDEGRQIES